MHRKELTMYTINETKTKWKVTTTIGKVTAIYDVPKELCPTRESLEKYIKGWTHEKGNATRQVC